MPIKPMMPTYATITAVINEAINNTQYVNDCTFKPKDVPFKWPSCNILIFGIKLHNTIIPMNNVIPIYITSLYSADEKPPNRGGIPERRFHGTSG